MGSRQWSRAEFHTCVTNPRRVIAPMEIAVPMVEVDGERTLWPPAFANSEGMVVTPLRACARKWLSYCRSTGSSVAHDKSSHLWDMADLNGVMGRLPKLEKDRIPLLDNSHVAMRVNLMRIHGGLCAGLSRSSGHDVIACQGAA